MMPQVKKNLGMEKYETKVQCQLQIGAGSGWIYIAKASQTTNDDS